MDGLTAIAPTYYVTGNHEWAVRQVPELKGLLTDHGVRVLSDEYELWTEDGATLAVAGVDDPNGPADQKTGPELREEIDADFTLLLSHRDSVETYASWGYDVVFCGHGHGGIFRIPIIDRGLLSSDRTLSPNMTAAFTRSATAISAASPGAWAATPCPSAFSGCSTGATFPSLHCAAPAECGRSSFYPDMDPSHRERDFPLCMNFLPELMISP